MVETAGEVKFSCTSHTVNFLILMKLVEAMVLILSKINPEPKPKRRCSWLITISLVVVL